MRVRECFRPRPGNCYFQADYSSLELHTLAQLCIKLFGYSALGDVLNKGLDPHVELAAEIMRLSPEEGRAIYADRMHPRWKELHSERQNKAKAGNFGLPGGMGVKRFALSSKLPESEARKVKDAWHRRWPETTEYFAWIAEKTNNPEGLCMLVDQFTGRVRGGTGYTNACNDGFQALGATIAKTATFMVSRACYTGDVEGEPLGASPLFGARLVNMVHDELIGECPADERAHDVAIELERLMIKAGDKYMTDVPLKAPPLLMSYWSKDAEACHDHNDRLVPWNNEKCTEPGCVDDKGKTRLATRRMKGVWRCAKHA